MKWMRMLAVSAMMGAGIARAANIETPGAESLAASAALAQDEANRLSIFHDYGISVIGTTPGDIPGTPGSGLIAPRLGSLAGADLPGPQSWSITATPIVGYDSNPQALNSARSSPFVGLDASANWNLGLTARNGNPIDFSAGYDVTGALNRGETKDADSIQQTVFAGIRHSMFADTIVLRGNVADQFTLQDGQAFLNSIDLSPSIEAFWLPQVSTELSYRFSHMDYFFPLLLHQQDPDTSRNTLAVSLHLFPLPQPKDAEVGEAPDRFTEILRRTLREMTIDYGHVWNDSNGTDYNGEFNRIGFGLIGIKPLASDDFTVDLNYDHEWQNYLNPSSEQGPILIGSPKEIRRKDHLDVFTLRVNAKLADLAKQRGTLAGFLQWDVVEDRSLLTVRDFNEYILSAGLTYRY